MVPGMEKGFNSGWQRLPDELPLRADFALVKAKKADYFGNLVFSLTAKEFQPLMVLACDTVLVEVEEIVPIGSLSPDEIHIPGVFVHYIVVGGRAMMVKEK